jgi:hypothetical protein
MRIYVDYSLRGHLVAPLKATYKGARQPSFLENAHVLSIDATVNGHQVLGAETGSGFNGGHVAVRVPGMSKAIFHVVYQPASHYWPMQLTETALFAGVAAVLILFAAWWTRDHPS